jgi:hypothetical protein
MIIILITHIKGFFILTSSHLYQIFILSPAGSSVVELHEGKLVSFTAVTFAGKEVVFQGLRAEFYQGTWHSYRRSKMRHMFNIWSFDHSYVKLPEVIMSSGLPKKSP